MFLFGRTAVMLTSSVEHDAACPGEVVIYLVFNIKRARYVILSSQIAVTAGCGEPIPPSGVFIENFQSAAEGSTITYSCSPGLVPTAQISVCTSLTWRPDPATLECREPLPGETGIFMIVFSHTSPADYLVIPSSTPTPKSTPILSSTHARQVLTRDTTAQGCW